MSLLSQLSQCAPSRWSEFLQIRDDQAQATPGENNDLFIGKNKKVTLTLNPGTETHFRDVVVLGELIIQSSAPENTKAKPLFTHRDCFVPGKFTATNVKFYGRNLYQPKNNTEFRKELQALFLEWMNFQRESVEKLGLKSILVE